MKIETVSVRNFRCFGPDWMEVRLQEQVTAFVGGNGSGKTALFQALTRLFGVTRTDRTVTKKDFHIAHDEEELPDGQSLEIECLLGFHAAGVLRLLFRTAQHLYLAGAASPARMCATDRWRRYPRSRGIGTRWVLGSSN